jgi:two-component system phosphate regulon sensor histidine kinase PhoR
VLAALHRLERDRRGASRSSPTRSRTAPRGAGAARRRGDPRRQNRIEWFNRTAEAQLQLDCARDLGQTSPTWCASRQFVDYLAAPRDDAVRIDARAASRCRCSSSPSARRRSCCCRATSTQAERVETMRRDFVANVSHELRTPLTVLVGFLETVAELKLDPQRQRDYLGMMQEQAARMQRIIEDLLTLSALDSAPPRPPTSASRGAAAERLQADADALSADATRSAAVDAQRPARRETELASAFGNLVSNAIRYTPPGGTVTLAWRDGPTARASASRTPASASRPSTSRGSPSASTASTAAARARPAAPASASPSPSTRSRATTRTLEIESTPGKGSRFSARFPRARLADVAKDRGSHID